MIIPAYNEQENIVSTVEKVVSSGYDYIVVNDGSTDNTLQVCRDKGLNVLDLPQNLGIGGAVQAGHKYAKAFGYDVDIQVDGDGQHDPRYIPRLLDGIGRGSDLVVGSRFLEDGIGFKSTFLRRVGISWLGALIRWCTGVIITDSTSGFRACGPRAIELFCREYPSDYPEPESIASAVKHGLTVSEVPVNMLARKGGESSIGGLSSVYYMIKVTLAVVIAAFSDSREK
ncbi:glycosyltransferase [Olsenella uli]|uniref:glycosyltransferase family 2 protein n=1 Tax=Olsenella uli TaxID=133926 RepID=UPI003D7B6F27